VPKKGKFTQERVEYNIFLFNEPRKGSKSLKNFKISLSFRFDKLSNLSKSVHTREQKKCFFLLSLKWIFTWFKIINTKKDTHRFFMFSAWNIPIQLGNCIRMSQSMIRRRITVDSQIFFITRYYWSIVFLTFLVNLTVIILKSFPLQRITNLEPFLLILTSC
jgi:hypothetical protein